MEKNQLNITWCYPDMLNLHGDRGNIMALERVGKLLGLDVKVNKVENYNTNIDFENTDILFFNAGELKLVAPIIEALKPQLEKLSKYIENGKSIIAIGNVGAVFAKELKRVEGQIINGFGFLDMNCTEREMIYGNDLIFTLKEDENMKIQGNQIQIMDTKLNSDIALGKIVYGLGNGAVLDNTEGAKYKNLIFTNALGPVLVKNPWFAEKIIREAMKQRGIEIEKVVDENEYEIEKKSMECVELYTNKKEEM